MLDHFKNLKLEEQQHPELSIFEPFDVVWEYSGRAMTEFHADIHYALQITMVLHGSVEMIFDDFQRSYTPGDIFWTTCWEPHAYRLSGERNFMMSINMNLDHLGQCGPFNYCDFMLPFSTAAAHRYTPEKPKERRFVLDSAKEVFHLAAKKPVNWHYHAWLRIHQLLLLAIDQLSDGGAPVKNDFRRIKSAITLVRRAQGRTPTLEEAAQACQLSVSRFSALFKNSIGMSYGQFSLHARLSKVAEELLYTNASMNELADRWGFFDASSLSNAFNKVYCCRPGFFKKNRAGK